jgi:hypothetical protein
MFDECIAGLDADISVDVFVPDPVDVTKVVRSTYDSQESQTFYLVQVASPSVRSCFWVSMLTRNDIAAPRVL